MMDASGRSGDDGFLSQSSRRYQALDAASAERNARDLESKCERYRLRLDQAMLKKFVVGPDVLDFPIGTGRLLEFSAKHYNLFGYDISAAYVERAKAHFPEIASHFEVHTMQRVSNPRRFNSVYSLRVTGHIQDLAEAVASVGEILAPGGRWIFNIAPEHKDYRRLVSLLEGNGMVVAEMLKYDAYSGQRKLKGLLRRFYTRWLQVVERTPVPFWLYRLVDQLMLPFTLHHPCRRREGARRRIEPAQIGRGPETKAE